MKVYNDDGQEEFEKYFKEKYIKSDKGYKQLLKKWMIQMMMKKMMYIMNYLMM